MTTSLVALPDGTLCETDIMGGQTFYTKLAMSCEHIKDDINHPVVVDGYLCSDSACNNCSDTSFTSGWQTKEEIAMLLNEDTAGNCQVWKTIESNNLDQLNDTNLETIFSTNATSSMRSGPVDEVVAYGKVYIGNTCLSQYISIEEPVESPPGPSPGGESNVFGGTEAGGSSATSNVWGLSLSMFAVAGLSAVILSV